MVSEKIQELKKKNNILILAMENPYQVKDVILQNKLVAYSVLEDVVHFAEKYIEIETI